MDPPFNLITRCSFLSTNFGPNIPARLLLKKKTPSTLSLNDASDTEKLTNSDALGMQSIAFAPPPANLDWDPSFDGGPSDNFNELGESAQLSILEESEETGVEKSEESVQSSSVWVSSYPSALPAEECGASSGLFAMWMNKIAAIAKKCNPSNPGDRMLPRRFQNTDIPFAKVIILITQESLFLKQIMWTCLHMPKSKQIKNLNFFP